MSVVRCCLWNAHYSSGNSNFTQLLGTGIGKVSIQKPPNGFFVIRNCVLQGKKGAWNRELMRHCFSIVTVAIWGKILEIKSSVKGLKKMIS